MAVGSCHLKQHLRCSHTLLPPFWPVLLCCSCCSPISMSRATSMRCVGWEAPAGASSTRRKKEGMARTLLRMGAARWQQRHHHASLCPLVPSLHGHQGSATLATRAATPRVACPVCLAPMCQTSTAAWSSPLGRRPSSPRCHPSWTATMAAPPTSLRSSGQPATAAASSSRHEPRRGWLLRRTVFSPMAGCL